MPWNGAERELRAAVRVFRVSGEGRVSHEYGSPAAGGGVAVFGVVREASSQMAAPHTARTGCAPYHGEDRNLLRPPARMGPVGNGGRNKL